LVERISQTLVEHQGNWSESRMARLAGQFAGILRVDLPDEKAEAFERACEKLKVEGLGLIVVRSVVDAVEEVRRTLLLEVIGHDRPGIVHEISHVLAKRRVNVEELTTGVESAPMSADLLFFVKAKLGVPNDLSTEELSQLLEPIGGDLMVDITLVPATV
jgi:glycine cleavage system regulatory protein